MKTMYRSTTSTRYKRYTTTVPLEGANSAFALAFRIAEAAARDVNEGVLPGCVKQHKFNPTNSIEVDHNPKSCLSLMISRPITSANI